MVRRTRRYPIWWRSWNQQGPCLDKPRKPRMGLQSNEFVYSLRYRRTRLGWEDREKSRRLAGRSDRLQQDPLLEADPRAHWIRVILSLPAQIHHESRIIRRMEGWKDGRMEGWKDGRMEGWKDGRMEGW